MGKIGIIATLVALIGAVRCYNANWDDAAASIPFAQAGAAGAPASLASIGKPAQPQLPETDLKKWFPTDPAADPYDQATWTAIDTMMAVASTPTGWTEVCKQAASAAGADRTASPKLAALACSDDPSVTELQRFAVHLLSAQAAVALWMKGAPGISTGTIAGRLSELRLDCRADVAARQADVASPFARACTKGLDLAYISGDGKATFASIGDAYALIAAEVARRSPKVAQEPAFFGAKDAKK